MLIQLILFLLAGISAGVVTGLIPGIHINLIGIFIVSLSSLILVSINPIYFLVFIVAMAITHTFVDFIPSIFLGCPDTDTELSVLPGHQLLRTGKGYEAIVLTAYGSLAAIITFIIIAYPSILFLSKIYFFIEKIIPYLLILASIILIFLEKKKLPALFVFLLAGFLGLSVFNLQMENSLLPLLTGLFGGSMLIMSIKNKTQIPKQKSQMPKTEIVKPLAGAFLGSLIASPLCCLLPGLGSGQAAVIGNIIADTNRRGFLVLLGATNTLVMGFSFITLYIISKTRTGAAIAIQEIIGAFSLKILILIITTTFITGIIAFILTIFLAKKLSQKITKINYTKLSLITLLILIIVVFLVSGFIGVMVLTASTITGVYCISFNVKRTNMMGCLIIPTILLYLI